jgi:hypothetical protein
VVADVTAIVLFALRSFAVLAPSIVIGAVPVSVLACTAEVKSYAVLTEFGTAASVVDVLETESNNWVIPGLPVVAVATDGADVTSTH